MRFPLICAAAMAIAAPAAAETYATGLGTISDRLTVEGGGAVMITGSAVAELASGGSVTATVLVDGAPCARSIRDGVAGIAMAKASCLFAAEAGRTHVVELVESHEAGSSRRSTLRTRLVADPLIPGTLLGEASGNRLAGASVDAGIALAIAVSGSAEIEFADAPGSLTGRSGVGSLEAVSRRGEAVELCFEGAFNQFREPPARMSCTVAAAEGERVEIGLAAPVGGGARVAGARLVLRTAE